MNHDPVVPFIPKACSINEPAGPPDLHPEALRAGGAAAGGLCQAPLAEGGFFSGGTTCLKQVSSKVANNVANYGDS